MEPLFLLIRLPFFFVAFLLLSAFVFPVMLLAYLWWLFVIPFVFIGCASNNNMRGMKEHMTDGLDACNFARGTFTGLWRWLLEGDHNNPVS